MVEFKLPDLKQEQSVLKTVRIKYNTLQKLLKITKENEISLNRLINECIEFALDNLNVTEKK